MLTWFDFRLYMSSKCRFCVVPAVSHYYTTLYAISPTLSVLLLRSRHYLKKHPGQIPKIWYFPPELGINSIYAINANMQDGTSQYDLRFGASFYDFSWFEGFDQEEILKNIQSPAIVMHVAPNKITAPGYYDANGVLLAAMDEMDAQRVVDLLPHGTYIGLSSSHIHADLAERLSQGFAGFEESNGKLTLHVMLAPAGTTGASVAVLLMRRNNHRSGVGEKWVMIEPMVSARSQAVGG